MKRKPANILYKKLTGPLRLSVISDAAFKIQDKTGLACRGTIIAVMGEQQKGGGPGGDMHIIDFVARRQKRVARSTFNAELNGVMDSVETAKMIAMFITWCKSHL